MAAKTTPDEIAELQNNYRRNMLIKYGRSEEEADKILSEEDEPETGADTRARADT